MKLIISINLLDARRWSRCASSPVSPCARHSHTACVSHARMFIYGGKTQLPPPPTMAVNGGQEDTYYTLYDLWAYDFGKKNKYS